MPGIQIIGAGNSESVKVTSTGQMQTNSVIVDLPHHTNIRHELAYVCSFTVTPSADSYFFYIKNGDDRLMIIEGAKVFTETSDEVVSLYANPDGSPTGGTTVTPINSNFGSNKVAAGTFEYGADLGGLSNGGYYGKSYFPATEVINYNFEN